MFDFVVQLFSYLFREKIMYLDNMNEMQKQQVIQQARTVSSKKEMSALVRNIGNYMT